MATGNERKAGVNVSKLSMTGIIRPKTQAYGDPAAVGIALLNKPDQSLTRAAEVHNV